MAIGPDGQAVVPQSGPRAVPSGRVNPAVALLLHHLATGGSGVGLDSGGVPLGTAPSPNIVGPFASPYALPGVGGLKANAEQSFGFPRDSMGFGTPGGDRWTAPRVPTPAEIARQDELARQRSLLDRILRQHGEAIPSFGLA